MSKICKILVDAGEILRSMSIIGISDSVLILLILLLAFNMTNGQKIDSLKSLLDKSTGNNRFELLYQIAYEYSDTDLNATVFYANEAVKSGKKTGDSLRIVRAGRIKSYALGRLGYLDSSIFISLEMLPIAKRNNYSEQLKHILNRLGSAYIQKAMYDKALDFYFQSHQLREKSGDKFELSVTLNNIGYVFFKLKDYDKALSYYTQSLNLKSEIENKYDLDILLLNLGLCHSYKDNFSKAREFVDKAFSLCGSNCSISFIMQASFGYGLIDFGLGKLVTSETHFLKSYKLAKELRNARFQLDNIIYLSRINIKQNELLVAEKYLLEADQLIRSGTHYNLEFIKVYNELSNLYQRYKRFDRMAYYQNKYIQLKDSIYGEELTRNLMRVESKYLERENYAKINAQTQVLLLNEEIILRQRILVAATSIIVVLLAVLTYVLFRNNRHKRAQNLFLEQKVVERTAELEKNNDVLLRSFEEQIVVFQKIATDVRSSMATIKGLCSLSLIDSEASNGGQYIRKIEATSDQLLNDVSRILAAKSMR